MLLRGEEPDQSAVQLPPFSPAIDFSEKSRSVCIVVRGKEVRGVLCYAAEDGNAGEGGGFFRV